MSENTFLIGNVDDIAAVVDVKDLDMADMRLNQVLRLEEIVALKLRSPKTNITLLIVKRIPSIFPVQMRIKTTENKRLSCN